MPLSGSTFLQPRRAIAHAMSALLIALSGAMFAGVPLTPAAAQSSPHSFTGMCAFYAGRGNGLTAAHRTLPLGTRLRVTDPKTGRSVIVTINDRGPFGGHRILDLSRRAAIALGMIDRGVIYVRAEIM